MGAFFSLPVLGNDCVLVSLQTEQPAVTIEQLVVPTEQSVVTTEPLSCESEQASIKEDKTLSIEDRLSAAKLLITSEDGRAEISKLFFSTMKDSSVSWKNKIKTTFLFANAFWEEHKETLSLSSWNDQIQTAFLVVGAFWEEHRTTLQPIGIVVLSIIIFKLLGL